MSRAAGSPSFAEYRTVSEAAKYLGVTPATLRNWDRAGKLKPRRHPQNGYRIYLHEDLESVLRSADLSLETGATPAPQVDWSDMGETEHFVQFYETDDFLVENVSGFVGAALSGGQASIVIATAEHRNALQRKLTAARIDTLEAASNGRYVLLDAAETLDRFMVGGMPDRARFFETVGDVVARLARGGRRIHAFGEMVSLLWADGNKDAAICLEDLWNDLLKRHRFSLFCAYPLAGFGDADDTVPFNGVCGCHSRVIPAESYSALDDPYERLKAISSLQQKAQSLEAEIAHRKEVTANLEKRERELADFFENATEGLHKVGPDGTILWANRAEYELLGYPVEEYIGRSISDFHPDADVIADILARLRRGESLENFPARLRCKDGSIRHVLINSSVCFEDGKFAYTRCFTRDITRRWNAEQELKNADRLKDEFLATLSHELRNPLAPIKNALETLRIIGTQDETAEELRQIMQRQVDSMTRLIDDLLDVSRITRDKIELRKERIDLADVIQSAIETSRPGIDAAGHELTVVLPDDKIVVDADPIRLTQVFSNLLNNSAKYTESGGQIQIEAARDGHEAVISVRDNGIGISCEALAYVFDMFRQVDRSLERAKGGLGIGLTVVRRLVELHGGSVNALSEGAGKGSEFVVRLPICGGDRASQPPAKAFEAVPRKRILVVDDNTDSGGTLARLLQLKGHEVRTASDGLEAVRIAETDCPDVILMDVGMPRMNGYEATRRIRQAAWGQDIFVVALTGWGQPDDLKASTEAGCSAHLVKPVNIAVLERLLRDRTGSRT
jgi:PAS domain S-box-containing protein